MKKIAIIGPINSRGGREIETAFIADTLLKNFEVSIFSTETIEKDNDLFLVNSSLSIYKKHKPFINKIRSFFGFKIDYQNLHFKKLYGQKLKSLHQVISEADLIIIVAQLTSNYTKEIILFTKTLKKNVIFRTTGTIPEVNIKDAYFSYLEDVSLFINHSEENSIVFKEKEFLNYKIIDQCVFKEDEILVDYKKNSSAIKKFYCASRLDENKDIITVIKAFNTLKAYKDLELHIIGNGPKLEHLKSKAKNKNITFYGHLDYDIMIETISNFDCLIIASKEEAGPYNALEAALLGIPILSTKVGAMMTRFDKEDNMWFDKSDWQTLRDKIIEYSDYSTHEVKRIQNHYIEIYKNNHSKKTIAKAYLETVSLYL